jgi:hypothetical protein
VLSLRGRELGGGGKRGRRIDTLTSKSLIDLTLSQRRRGKYISFLPWRGELEGGGKERNAPERNMAASPRLLAEGKSSRSL